MNLRIGLWFPVLVFVSGCGGAETPAQPSPPLSGNESSPPFVLQVSVDVEEAAGREPVAALTEISVEATAIGSTGTVAYSVDFGDGATATGPSARHVYSSPGVFTIRVEVKDATARSASASREVAVGSVSGTLVNAGFNVRTGKLEVRSFVVTGQEGTAVRGVFRASGEPDRSFVGVLSRPRTLRLSVDGTAQGAEATLPDRISEDGGAWPLRMRGDSVDGQLLTFKRAAGAPSGAAPDAILEVHVASPSMVLPLVDLTPVTFDGSRSRGTDLSYFIEFGDGEVFAGPRVDHPLRQEGGVRARLTVVDRFGRADAESADLLSMSLRTWQGDSWFQLDPGGGLFLHFFERDGRNYRGWGYHNASDFAPLTATVSGENQITITFPSLGFELRGTVYFGAQDWNHRLTLVQYGGAGNGRTLTFGYYSE